MTILLCWHGARAPKTAPRQAGGGASDGRQLVVRRLGGQRAGDLLDRLHDIDVAGAAAQVAGEPLADLLLGGLWVLLDELENRHQHAGRAEAALQAVLVP